MSFLSLLLTVALAAERTAPPAVVPAEPIPLPEATTSALGPGVRLHWLQVPGVRRVVVDVQVRTGAVALAGRRTEAVAVAEGVWTLAAEGYEAAELEGYLARHDIDLYAQIGDEDSLVGLSVPREHLGAALPLLGAMLRAPSFHKKDVKRVVRDEVLALEESLPHEARPILGTLTSAAWFPASDPRRAARSPAELRKVRPSHLLDLHERLLRGGPIDVLVVGDVSASDWTPQLMALTEGLGSATPEAPRLGARAPGVPAALAVDLEEQDQAWIGLRLPAPHRTHPDAPAFGAVAWALGGHFLSRLNQTLREEKGWTYGASGRWSPDDEDGTWTFVVDVAEANVGDALNETLSQVAQVAGSGLRPDELSGWKTNVVASWNLSLGTADGASGVWGDLVREHERVADARAWLDRQLAVTPEDTARVARAWFGSTERLVVIVGDRAAVEAPLQPVIGALTWLEPEAAVLGVVPAVQP